MTLLGLHMFNESRWNVIVICFVDIGCIVDRLSFLFIIESKDCGVLRHFQQYFSYIVVVSFIGGGNRSIRRKPPTCRKSLTNLITQCCIEHTSPWAGFELTTLGAIGTACICSSKSNYNTTRLRQHLRYRSLRHHMILIWHKLIGKKNLFSTRKWFTVYDHIHLLRGVR